MIFIAKIYVKVQPSLLIYIYKNPLTIFIPHILELLKLFLILPEESEGENHEVMKIEKNYHNPCRFGQNFIYLQNLITTTSNN